MNPPTLISRPLEPPAAPTALPAAPPAPPMAGWHLTVAAVALLAAVCDALVASPLARSLLTLLAALTLPGTALLARSGFSNWASQATKMAAASISLEVVVALAMLWAGAWHPVDAGIGLGAASIASLLARTARAWPAALARGCARLRQGLAATGASALITWAPLLAAVALWFVSLDMINAANFGADGLVGQAPVLFFVGLGVLVAGLAFLSARGGSGGWLLAAYILVLVVYLYGTIPAVSSAPQYAWTYKHIGVTRMIMATGTVHPNVDIYNRWPGMFAVAAWFSTITKVDPMAYAGWAEFVFAGLQAVGVAALVLRFTRRRDIAALSTLVWLITNWIGQTYFSPQAMAYLLDLGIMLILLESMPAGTRFSMRLVGLLERALRRPPQGGAEVARIQVPRFDCGLVLLLDFAAVASHQLTPYMVILQALALCLFGLRPRWLVFAITAITIAYLLPNAAWVQAHYGLFSGFNPVDNAQVQRVQAHRAWFYSHVGGMLSMTTMLLGFIAAIRLIRVGEARRAASAGALALAPFALLFGNNYGGEGALRVFMFASPWLSLLIGWALSTVPRRVRVGVTVALSVSLTGLFLFAFIGNAGTNVIPRDEVTASEYFYTHAPHGSVLMLAGEDFPLEASPEYRFMAGPGGDHSPNLLEETRFLGRRLGAADLPAIIHDIRSYSSSGFLAFSTTQNRYAAYFGTTPPGTFPALERVVAASPRFRLWYSTPNAQIYRLVSGTGGAS